MGEGHTFLINSKHALPPSPLAIFLLISIWQMPQGGASLITRTNAPWWGPERVLMTNLFNKKTLISHKFNVFYRICNSSNHFLTAETATFWRSVHILFFSSLVHKWKQLCKYLHMCEWKHNMHSTCWQCTEINANFPKVRFTYIKLKNLDALN